MPEVASWACTVIHLVRPTCKWCSALSQAYDVNLVVSGIERRAQYRVTRYSAFVVRTRKTIPSLLRCTSSTRNPAAATLGTGSWVMWSA